MKGRILTISESDSCGGAGIQGDIRTAMALGGYAASAVTAVTVQNTRGVETVYDIPASIVASQIETVLQDVGADVLKTGILYNSNIIDTVADLCEEKAKHNLLVVVDPSIVTRAGTHILDTEDIALLKRRLLVHADVITPNRKEAELLTGMTIRDLDAMMHAADMMRTLGADAVVLKGGQLDSDTMVDLIAWDDGEEVIKSPVIDTVHTHGAGGALATGIAVGLAQQMDVLDAAQRAIDYMNRTIVMAHELGQGVAPVNHACTGDGWEQADVAAQRDRRSSGQNGA